MPNLWSNKIKIEDLKPGDHIYTWSSLVYSHHGIYIGNRHVIHYVRGNASKFGSSASSSHNIGNTGGVIWTTLDEFLDGRKLYLFVYDADNDFFKWKRGGTCTIDRSDPPDVVIHRAKYLFKHGNGVYDLTCNNCENFAVYCKTGRVNRETGEIGYSGQVASNVIGASAVMSVFMLPGIAFFRLDDERDRIRKSDKVPVEELAGYCGKRGRIL